MVTEHCPNVPEGGFEPGTTGRGSVDVLCFSSTTLSTVTKVVCKPGGESTKTIQEGIQKGVWHLYESKISKFQTSWADISVIR